MGYSLYQKGEFHRIKELFNHTLLNLTLWMAIASFSFQIITDVDIDPIHEWILSVFGMNITDNILIGIEVGIFTIAGVAFIVSILVTLFLAITWVSINFIRLFTGKNKEDKGSNYQDRFDSVL